MRTIRKEPLPRLPRLRNSELCTTHMLYRTVYANPNACATSYMWIEFWLSARHGPLFALSFTAFFTFTIGIHPPYLLPMPHDTRLSVTPLAPRTPTTRLLRCISSHGTRRFAGRRAPRLWRSTPPFLRLRLASHNKSRARSSPPPDARRAAAEFSDELGAARGRQPLRLGEALGVRVKLLLLLLPDRRRRPVDGLLLLLAQLEPLGRPQRSI